MDVILHLPLLDLHSVLKRREGKSSGMEPDFLHLGFSSGDEACMHVLFKTNFLSDFLSLQFEGKF
uniref:Uncharacterized protein n=1 Tax=Anguilla anguilla TaxID=7936 RepID=A0A0E9PDN8_ANGAN